MKKIRKSLIAAIMLVFLAASAALFLTSSNHEKNEVLKNNSLLYLPEDSLPGEIQDIVNSSCINCHATGGRALAMAKLNFSEWDQYDHEKQMKKAAKMCKLLTKGKMPPKSYLNTHPDAKPTKEQIEIVCKWAKSIKTE